MAKHWIKLWVESLYDPKIARLPDWLYRKFTEVLLFAGMNDKAGILPPVSDLAWVLHISEEKMTEALMGLASVGVVRQEPDGSWLVVNFCKRQETPDAERMRRKRERDRENSEQLRNSSPTVAEQDSASASPLLLSVSDSGSLFKLYESEIGTVTKHMADVLASAWDEYPHEWFQVAIAEAVRNNARKWAYVEAILKRWKTDGFQRKNGKSAPKKETIFDRERRRIAAEEEAAKHGKREAD